MIKVIRQVETKSKRRNIKFQRKDNSRQIIKQDNFISISMVHNDHIIVMNHFNRIHNLAIFHVRRCQKYTDNLIEAIILEYYKALNQLKKLYPKTRYFNKKVNHFKICIHLKINYAQSPKLLLDIKYNSDSTSYYLEKVKMKFSY